MEKENIPLVTDERIDGITKKIYPPFDKPITRKHSFYKALMDGSLEAAAFKMGAHHVLEQYESARLSDKKRISDLEEQNKKLREGLKECEGAMGMVEMFRQTKERNRHIHDPRLVIRVDPKDVWPRFKRTLADLRDLLTNTENS